MNNLISRQWLMECVNEGWIKFDTKKDENRFIHLVRDIAPSAEPEQHWIPVTERMPKIGKTVICQCRADILKLLKLDSGGDWYQDAEHAYMSGFVLAWMPLPELWRGEEDGNVSL